MRIFEALPDRFEVCHEASCGYGHYHDLPSPIAARVRGWLPAWGRRQAVPAGEGLRSTARRRPAGVPQPSPRAARPGAEPLRAGRQPHDSRGQPPRHRPPLRTPTPSHTACGRPPAANSRLAPRAPRELRPSGPAGEPEVPDRSLPGWRRRPRRWPVWQNADGPNPGRLEPRNPSAGDYRAPGPPAPGILTIRVGGDGRGSFFIPNERLEPARSGKIPGRKAEVASC